MTNFKKTLFDLKALLILIALVIVAGILSPVFLTQKNLLNVLLAVSVTAILAIGETYIIILGEIDLSVGAIMGMCGAICAGVLTHNNIFVAILVGLLLGAAAGALNGVLVTFGRMPSFIATLGTMTAFGGITLAYTGGNPISTMVPVFQWFGQGYLWIIPVPVAIMIILYTVFWFLLHRTHYGRHVFATGGNIESSRLSGVGVRQVKVIAFMVSGLLAAVASVIFTARLSTAVPTAGDGMQLDAIAAVILGGTSLAGGRGRLVGTVIGAIILGVLDDSMNLLNVSAFYQDVVKGVIIILAVLLDSNVNAITGFFSRRRAGTNLLVNETV